MKRNILLVEDNEKSRGMLIKILKDIDNNMMILEADNVDRAYKYAMECTINLFILDIILDTSVRDDVSGIAFADHMRKIPKYKSTPIIFITSLEDPKLYAYSEIHCYQYIEKPYDINSTTIKIKEALGLEAAESKSRYICFRKDGLLFPVEISKIVYIVFSKPIMDIVLVNDTLRIAYQPLKKVLLKLDNPDFGQCNRNTIVNMNYIANIDLVSGFLQMKNMDRSLSLGNVYKRKFMSEMEND